MYNTCWYVVTCTAGDVSFQMSNPSKDYTLLRNNTNGQYVVAWNYNQNDNTWGQGHYFNDFDEAVLFMYRTED